MIFFLFFLSELIRSETVTLENEKYLAQTWTIENNKLSTKEIINKRTDGSHKSIVPQAGSEEIIIALDANTAESDWPTPISSDGWTIYANSEQSPSGKEGPATNLLDGDRSTIWHSWYQGSSGHDDRPNHEGPFYFIVDLKKATAFKAISYANRPNGGNGAVTDFQLYIGDTEDAIKAKIEKNEFELESTFEVNHNAKCFINLTKELTANFVAIKTLGDGKFASGSLFEIYASFLPTVYYYIKSSDLTLEKHEATEDQITFTFAKYDFMGTTWEIVENVKIQQDKHYLHKSFKIKNNNDNVIVAYIDLQHIVISSEDLPNSWGTPMVECTFKNLGQPFYINTLFTGCRFPLAHTLIEKKNIGRVRYCTGKKFGDFKKDENGFYNSWETVLGAARSERIEVVRTDFFNYISDIAVPSPFRKQYNSWYDWMLEITESNIMKSFKEIERGCSQYGIPPLDSYVVDDGWNNYNNEDPDFHEYNPKVSGTTYNHDGFWAFNDKFPSQFTPPSDYTRKIKSYFGVWLGPRGGYGSPGSFGHLIEKAGKGYYSAASNDVDVASHKYIKGVKDLLVQFIKDFKVNYYKLDGFTSTPCQNATHDHVVGGEDGVNFYTDMWEHYLEAYQEMIDTAKGVGLDNFWISSTTFTNLSPPPVVELCLDPDLRRQRRNHPLAKPQPG